jgi:hypothetical protein
MSCAISASVWRERLHWSFPDLRTATDTEAEQLAVYRQVRDAIRERIEHELITPSKGLSTRPRPSVGDAA